MATLYGLVLLVADLLEHLFVGFHVCNNHLVLDRLLLFESLHFPSLRLLSLFPLPATLFFLSACIGDPLLHRSCAVRKEGVKQCQLSVLKVKPSKIFWGLLELGPCAKQDRFKFHLGF
jgi:hypothetical protein